MPCCFACTHAQHLENSSVAGLARLNCYYMKASPPGCRASPVGVKRAGPVRGLARFHVIIPFAFVMFTLLGGLARLPSQPGYRASSPPCNQGLKCHDPLQTCQNLKIQDGGSTGQRSSDRNGTNNSRRLVLETDASN